MTNFLSLMSFAFKHQTKLSSNSEEINTKKGTKLQQLLPNHHKLMDCYQFYRDFLCEILEILQNSNIQIELNSEIHEITYENVFSHLFEDLTNSRFYQTIISKDIDIISQNTYQILSKEEERGLLFQLD